MAPHLPFSHLPTPLFASSTRKPLCKLHPLGAPQRLALSVPFGQVFPSNPGPRDCPSSKTSSTSWLRDVLGACSAAKRRCTNPQAGCLPPGSTGLQEENLGLAVPRLTPKSCGLTVRPPRRLEEPQPPDTGKGLHRRPQSPQATPKPEGKDPLDRAGRADLDINPDPAT